MRVCLIGRRGMLGHVVSRYLEERGHRILVPEERFPAAGDVLPYVERVNRLGPEWCVNAAGVRRGPLLDRVNHRLPEALSRHLSPSCSLIHVSSDGVFRAGAGPCPGDREPDAIDPYGLSKRRGEEGLQRDNDRIVRTSLVGPETGSPPRGLLGWLLSQEAGVEGWTNQAWNGITTLECARLFCGIIEGRVARRTTHAGFLPPVDKRRLLEAIARQWGWPHRVSPALAPAPSTRYLVPDEEAPPLDRQLRELRRWY